MTSGTDARVTVVINPASGVHHGRHAGTDCVALAGRVLDERGAVADVRLTEGPGHARDLARQAAAEGVPVVFAWGGDGTVNEVASALAFGSTALGVVPAGSGNGLAHALGIPRHADAALRYGLDHVARRIDVGELGGRLFVNVAGVGLDARVAARFAAHPHRRGRLPYALFAARELMSPAAAEYGLEVDGEPARRRAVVIALANSPQYGSGAIIAPHARLDDGRLHLVVVAPLTVAAVLTGIPRLFRGTITRSRRVSERSVERVRISSESPILFHVDGEPVCGDPAIDARVHRGALLVRA